MYVAGVLLHGGPQLKKSFSNLRIEGLINSECLQVVQQSAKALILLSGPKIYESLQTPMSTAQQTA